MESFDGADRTQKRIKPFEAEPSASSLQSLHWNIEDDSSGVGRGTRNEILWKIRELVVLSFVASVFDPLGIFAFFTMRMTILLKTVELQLGQLWDEDIPKDDELVFGDWAKELQQPIDRKLDGCYFLEKPSSVDLHIFPDAILETMCVVAYLKAESDSGVNGKNRTASMKQKTTPKLQLQTALDAVRLRQLFLEVMA